MATTTDLLLAAEVIKRAEELRDRAAAASASKERKDGAEENVDVLRGRYKGQHPYTEFIPKVMEELKAVAELIGSRPTV